jgi:hypothetical protein
MIRTALTLAALLLAPGTALAQLPLPLPLPLPMEGTPEDRAACEVDVRRYCQTSMPDTMRVLACLQANRQRLGRPCQGVLIKYGQ